MIQSKLVSRANARVVTAAAVLLMAAAIGFGLLLGNASAQGGYGGGGGGGGTQCLRFTLKPKTVRRGAPVSFCGQARSSRVTVSSTAFTSSVTATVKNHAFKGSARTKSTIAPGSYAVKAKAKANGSPFATATLKVQ